MGIEAQLMQGGRCVLAQMRLQRQIFETRESTLQIDEVVFVSVGGDRAKCLQPRALFQLPILRILDCRDATAIEARIHLAWQRHAAQLERARQWLDRIGADWQLEEECSVLAVPMAGEDTLVKTRMIELRSAILPSRGPLSGIKLEQLDDRVVALDTSIESGIDLEIAVTNRLEELARLDDRLAAQRRVDALGDEEQRADLDYSERRPCVLLVGPRISDERACIESLRLRGYHVEAVTNVRSAVTTFDRCSPELVIADLQLDRAEGFDLITSLREVPGIEEVPVVIVDKEVRPERRATARRLGAAGYITYPVDVGRISDRLSTIVHEPRRRRFTRYSRKVSVQMPGRDCVTTAIGRGGMFLALDDDLQQNTLHECRISLPELGANVRVRAEVLYRARTNPMARHGVGVRFHSFPDSNEPVLIEYLRSCQTDPSNPTA